MTQPGMPSVPRPVPSALKTVLDLMGRQLPVAKNADPCRFIDDRFIRELEQSGFVAALANS